MLTTFPTSSLASDMEAAITVTKIRNYGLDFRFENKNGKRDAEWM